MARRWIYRLQEFAGQVLEVGAIIGFLENIREKYHSGLVYLGCFAAYGIGNYLRERCFKNERIDKEVERRLEERKIEMEGIKLKLIESEVERRLREREGQKQF